MSDSGKVVMAQRQFTLYPSSVLSFRECGRKFLWGRGFGDIDVGGGPGRPKPKPEQRSNHDAIMGLALAKGMELLYNDQLYRDPANLVQKLTDIVTKEFEFNIRSKYVNWRESPPKDEMLQICLDGIVGYLRTMKSQKLLGPYSVAELDLKVWVDSYTRIGGRPDVVIRRDDNGLTILDGKNARTPGKYTDPDQLRWYALCFYLIHNVLPNRLAFVYFRYPEGTPPKDHDPSEPWTGLVDVPCTMDDIKSLAVKARETYKAMMGGLFDPTPSPSSCRFCDYQSVCDSKHVPVPRKKKEEASLPAELGSGVTEFGFSPVSSIVRKPKS